MEWRKEWRRACCHVPINGRWTDEWIAARESYRQATTWWENTGYWFNEIEFPYRQKAKAGAERRRREREGKIFHTYKRMGRYRHD